MDFNIGHTKINTFILSKFYPFLFCLNAKTKYILLLYIYMNIYINIFIYYVYYIYTNDFLKTKWKETDNNDYENLLGTKIDSKLSFDDHVCVHMHMYMNMSVYIYTHYMHMYILYISGHKWSTTHRVLKSHKSNMSVIYMQSWKK